MEWPGAGRLAGHVRDHLDHAADFDPPAANQDRLSGPHANTQIPKWVGAAREYKATGITRYRDIAVRTPGTCASPPTPTRSAATARASTSGAESAFIGRTIAAWPGFALIGAYGGRRHR
ncbi:beta-L-arabinofuranosidase domain-containing protein [Streptosporangium sp. CA-115845]|uniref:beta-L-arabinofuranosidase domain-containing protein n=1 Tax=Streptosporangium sp. CA-115845 TaxID=3240071 RepID=UPI003D8F5016